MLSIPAFQMLPAPGVMRRVLADKKNRALLDAMTELFSVSPPAAISCYITKSVRLNPDYSEMDKYYHITEGVLPALALLNIDPQFTVLVEKNCSTPPKKQILSNYREEFDTSTNYKKAILFHGLMDAGFKNKDICKCFSISKVYLSKSKALITLPEQYRFLFKSGKIDDVNAAYDLHHLNDNEGLLFFQLLKDGESPRSAIKIIHANSHDLFAS